MFLEKNILALQHAVGFQYNKQQLRRINGNLGCVAGGYWVHLEQLLIRSCGIALGWGGDQALLGASEVLLSKSKKDLRFEQLVLGHQQGREEVTKQLEEAGTLSKIKPLMLSAGFPLIAVMDSGRFQDVSINGKCSL